MEKLKDENTNNDLSEFGVDSDAPDLFNSDKEYSSSNDLLSSENEEQEVDLKLIKQKLFVDEFFDPNLGEG